MSLDEDTPLGRLYRGRVEDNQDLVVLVDDRHNRRGTGKTVLSLGLAAAMDRTDAGVTTEKVAIAPEPLIDAYTDQPPGSALVLDEAEVGASKFQAGTQVNRALRRLVSMGRIEEKYVIMNLPSASAMDKDLRSLADVWIMVEERGRALVHFLGWDPYGGHPLTPKKQTLEWSDLSDPQLREVYDHLTDRKRARLRGDSEGSEFVSADDVDDRVEAAAESAERETRDQLIRRLYREGDLTQKEIADAVDLSRSRVADILSSESTA